MEIFIIYVKQIEQILLNFLYYELKIDLESESEG